MRRTLPLLGGIALAGCHPEDQVLTQGSETAVMPVTSAAPARLAKYDGMKMRARMFSKKNGQHTLLASASMKFQRQGNKLRLIQGFDESRRLWIGAGAELAGGRGNQEALPPCDLNTPLNEQPPCALPNCEDVDNVEPCEPPEPGGGEGGGGGGEGGGSGGGSNPFDTILTDTI